MNRIILLLACLFSTGFLTLEAQTPSFGKGDKVLNLGVGFGTYETGYNVTLLPLSASFEVGVADKVFGNGSFGVGGFIGYASYKTTSYSGNAYWTYNKAVIGARGNLHYPLADKLDTYVGLMLGYKNISWTWHGSGSESKTTGTGGAFSLFVGGRYYLSQKFALNAELGLGIDILNVGIALKL